MSIIVIDNYDSFTWNIAHQLARLTGNLPQVLRNDEATAAEVIARRAEAIVISPGPSNPDSAGITLSVIEHARNAEIPIFGICLGFQALVQHYGGRIIRAKQPIHGKISPIRHNKDMMFADIPEDFTATRYHSLIAASDDFPKSFTPTAWLDDDDSLIMAAANPCHRMYGVLFHTESIGTTYGTVILANFLRQNTGLEISAPATNKLQPAIHFLHD